MKINYFKKAICLILAAITVLICSMLCACGQPGDGNDNSGNKQPEETKNYPIEGIWYSNVISGHAMRNEKNEYPPHNQLFEYCIWFVPGGGIKTKWKTVSTDPNGLPPLQELDWWVRDFTWDIDGYIVTLSNSDKKLVMLEDTFEYLVTESHHGYRIVWANNNLTFSKTEDERFTKEQI